MNSKRNDKGFSLVELIVVIAIMAVLIGVLAPTLIKNIEKSRESTDLQNLDALRDAVINSISDDTDIYDEAVGDDTHIICLGLGSSAKISNMSSTAYPKLKAEIIDKLGDNITMKSRVAKVGYVIIRISKDGKVNTYVSTNADGSDVIPAFVNRGNMETNR